MRACVHVSVCVCVHVSLCVGVGVYTYVHEYGVCELLWCVHICVFVCMYACLLLYMCQCITQFCSIKSHIIVYTIL